jgi:hypothetical protein
LESFINWIEYFGSMRIYEHDIKEVEAFVQSHIGYLDEVLRIAKPNSKIERIIRNPDQGARKALYDLYLSDDAIVVLKLFGKKGIEQEIAGLNYASSVGVPNPGLICYELNPDKKINSLQNPFLMMGHVILKPVEMMFTGDYKLKKCGRELCVNREALDQYIQEASDLMIGFHQMSSQINPAYHADNMKRLFESYQDLFERKVAPRLQHDLTSELINAFSFFEANQTSFQSAEYFLHGDLDPTNIAHTPDGLALIDFECFHTGDSAEDIAYFIHRNVLIPKDAEEQIGSICENYSKNDASFTTRLKFHLQLSKLWHMAIKGMPRESFLDIDSMRI